jgi:hypothetical protein
MERVVAAAAAVKEHGNMTGKQHKVAFYADIFYNSEPPSASAPPARAAGRW